MAIITSDKALDRTYFIGLYLKAADGVLELLGAALLLFISPHAITSGVAWLTNRELSDDPHDFIAAHLQTAAHHFLVGGRTFAVLYLLFHGLIKLIVVFGLLKNQRWAYPFSLITLGLFVIYQTYQIAIDHSIGLVLLTIFDLFVIYLVWREWRKGGPDQAKPASMTAPPLSE